MSNTGDTSNCCKPRASKKKTFPCMCKCVSDTESELAEMGVDVNTRVQQVTSDDCKCDGECKCNSECKCDGDCKCGDEKSCKETAKGFFVGGTFTKLGRRRTRKLALLIGILYKGSDAELGGCVNDIRRVREVLISKFGYSSSDIVMLHDDGPNDHSSILPTGANIIRELDRMLSECKKRKSDVSDLFIHYSGHGYYFKDRNGDETDGRDELIVPVDYMEGGVITDDYLTYYMQKLPRHIKCTSVFDCCHSGTILDLKYQYRANRNIVENKHYRGKAKVLMISGCRDDQTSADAYDPKRRQWNGALTDNLLKVMKDNNYQLSAYDLLRKVHVTLKQQEHMQRPQICCSYELTRRSRFTSKKRQSNFFEFQ